MHGTVHATGSLEWDTPLYAQASTQLEHALALAEVPDFVASRLRYAERDRDEIRRRLADKLSDAFDRVWAVAHDRGISLRDAELVAAIHEVSAALEARGIYP